MKKYIVKKVEEIVERECKKPTSPFSCGSWETHILVVVGFANDLSKKVKADKEVVELAALLHDIGAIMGDSENHHVSGAEEAERILQKLNYPQEKIEKVKHCIFAHRASKRIKRRTIEARCVASADAMAHFDQIPQLLRVAFIVYKMTSEEAKIWILEKLGRSQKKLMPEAKEMIKDKYEAAKLILE